MLARRRPWSRFAAGIGLWGALALALAGIGASRGGDLGRPAGKLARFAFSREQRIDATLISGWDLREGDPLIGHDRRPIGRVVDARIVKTEAAPVGTAGIAPACTYTWAVTIAVDPEVDATRIAAGKMRIGAARGDFRWVMETLLPPRKRDAVKKEVDAFLAQNGDLLAQALRPIADEVLAHSMGVLEKNLSPALQKHEAEIKRVIGKDRTILKNDLLPTLKERLGPKAKEKLKPIFKQIGRELWGELPMWSVSWRALVDQLPGNRDSYLDQYWQEFLDRKAIPIVAAHEDEIVTACEELAEEGAKDPKVREAFAVSTRKLAQDPEFKALVRGVVEDAVVKPFDPKELLARLEANPDHKSRLMQLEKAFAPHGARIARILAVEEGTGKLDPDLARVLRRAVFKKDQRWIEVDFDDADALVRGGAK